MPNLHLSFLQVKCQSPKEKIQDFTNDYESSIQTPPLPVTPQPIVQTAKVVNPNTNLTRTQEALLSPEEKVIASKRTI